MPDSADGVGSLSKAFEPVSFVTGASGYVGRKVMAELQRANERVQGRSVAHVRPGSAQLEACRREFEALDATVDTTPWDEQAMAGTLGALKPTHLFHLVGTTKRRAASEGIAEPYAEVDLGLFQLLLNAALTLETAPRVIYLSSKGASPRSPARYLRTRFQCEELLRASGLPYTIARPGLFTGPDRDPPRKGERAAAAVLRPMAGLLNAIGLGGSAARLRPFDAQELGYGLVHAGFNYTTIGRVLRGEELRYKQTKDREWSGPASHRDGLRY